MLCQPVYFLRFAQKLNCFLIGYLPDRGLLQDGVAVKKLLQVFPCKFRDFLCGARPLEMSGFDPLIQEQESVPLPDEGLKTILLLPAEEKQDVLLERREVELHLHDGCQPIHSLAQICISGCDIDPVKLAA